MEDKLNSTYELMLSHITRDNFYNPGDFGLCPITKAETIEHGHQFFPWETLTLHIFWFGIDDYYASTVVHTLYAVQVLITLTL